MKLSFSEMNHIIQERVVWETNGRDPNTFQISSRVKLFVAVSNISKVNF